MVQDADPNRVDQRKDRQEVEIRDEELEEILSDELDNAEGTRRGSTPCGWNKESYRGNSKDVPFIGGGDRVALEFSDRAGGNAGDEDEGMCRSSSGSGGDDGDVDARDDGDGTEESQNSLEAKFGALQP